MIRNRFEIYATQQAYPDVEPQERLAWAGHSEVACRRALDTLPAKYGATWRNWRVLDYGERIPGAPENMGYFKDKNGDSVEISVRVDARQFAVITRPTKEARYFYHEMGRWEKAPTFPTQKAALAHAVERAMPQAMTGKEIKKKD